MCIVCDRDAEIKEEVKKSREDRSPKSGRLCHRNGQVNQENSQRIPIIRYGELIVLGYVQNFYRYFVQIFCLFDQVQLDFVTLHFWRRYRVYFWNYIFFK